MERALRQHLPGGVFSSVTARASKNFSAVRGRNNRTTEVRFRLALVRSRIRGWKLQPVGLPGNPDFIFQRKRLAIFVDGCFWHGCSQCGHIPKTNSAFWAAKIQRNFERDKRNNIRLGEIGFQVVRIWEHELKNDLPGCVALVRNLVKQARKRKT
jgi:DNA mismatch endonuclease (patch repair protein)